MGISITAITAVGVLFKDYEIVKEETEQVRFDQYTGEKITHKQTSRSLKYQGETVNGFWELSQILQHKFGLELFQLNQEDWESSCYIGESISYMDAKRAESPSVISHNELEKVFERVKEKCKKAGYDDVEPVLLNCVKYN